MSRRSSVTGSGSKRKPSTRSEIDHLNGFIVRRGEALGIATPANRLLHAIVKLIESGFIAPARNHRPRRAKPCAI
jgi:hypothetical protein